jgi:hypothetical protein
VETTEVRVDVLVVKPDEQKQVEGKNGENFGKPIGDNLCY